MAPRETMKLRCVLTGNWSYVDPDRYAKLCSDAGGEDKLKATYQSREGKKLREEVAKEIYNKSFADLSEPQQVKVSKALLDPNRRFKGKVRCIITGELMVCSDERFEKLLRGARETDEGATVEMVHKTYVSRIARRLRTQKARAILNDTEGLKGYNDLSAAQQKQVDNEIRNLAANDELPRAAVVKGARQEEKAEANKAPATIAKDTSPADKGTAGSPSTASATKQAPTKA